MASKLISYDERTDTFELGNERGVTDAVIRQRIAETLRITRWSGGREVVEFKYVNLTVQYLMQMLDFTDKHGWFWDSFDLAGPNADHDFDWNRITPGNSWGEAQELKEEGRDALSAAEYLRERGLHRLADTQVRVANGIFRAAHRLIVTGGSPRR